MHRNSCYSSIRTSFLPLYNKNVIYKVSNNLSLFQFHILYWLLYIKKYKAVLLRCSLQQVWRLCTKLTLYQCQLLTISLLHHMLSTFFLYLDTVSIILHYKQTTIIWMNWVMGQAAGRKPIPKEVELKNLTCKVNALIHTRTGINKKKNLPVSEVSYNALHRFTDTQSFKNIQRFWRLLKHDEGAATRAACNVSTWNKHPSTSGHQLPSFSLYPISDWFVWRPN